MLEPRLVGRVIDRALRFVARDPAAREILEHPAQFSDPPRDIVTVARIACLLHGPVAHLSSGADAGRGNEHEERDPIGVCRDHRGDPRALAESPETDARRIDVRTLAKNVDRRVRVGDLIRERHVVTAAVVSEHRDPARREHLREMSKQLLIPRALARRMEREYTEIVPRTRSTVRAPVPARCPTGSVNRSQNKLVVALVDEGLPTTA